MSPTRTPKPPDKGTPDPKPSRKVALNELLRSLQDLVSNELAIEPAGAKPAPPAAPTTPVAPDRAPAPPEPDLQAGEMAEPPPFPVDGSFETESITLEGLPDIPPEPTPAAPAKATIPPGGLQQELPYLDAISAPPVVTSTSNEALLVEPETPMPELPGTETLASEDKVFPPSESVDNRALLVEPEVPMPELPGTDTLPDTSGSAVLPATAAEPVTPTLPELPSTGVAGPAASGSLSDASVSLTPAEDGSLHDIPVLEDAVELPDEPLSSAPATPLPPAADARRLAIQVAARLNVELRKQGKRGLASDVIAHLAHLLEDALAKGRANMENSPPK